MSSSCSSGDLPTRPLVCDRISLTVMGWDAFLSTTRSRLFFSTTIWPWNSGRYFSTGSSSRNFPASTSIMSAVAVIGLDIEAIQKIASVCIGTLAPRSE